MQKTSLLLLYEMDKLHDKQGRRYATYEVKVDKLAEFERAIGVEKIEYVHE